MPFLAQRLNRIKPSPTIAVTRKAADLKYFLSVMPWRDALRVWKRGSESFAQND